MEIRRSGSYDFLCDLLDHFAGFILLVWGRPTAESSCGSMILSCATVINLLIPCSVFGHNSILSLVCKTALSSGGGSGSSKFNLPALSITLSDQSLPYFSNQLLKPHVARCCGHITHAAPECFTRDQRTILLTSYCIRLSQQRRRQNSL